LLVVLCACVSFGCKRYREDLDYSYKVQQTWSLDGSGLGEFAQFESVFWEPDDTVSLRQLIAVDEIASGRDVLEIGTGTGLLSVLCLHHGADKVVATDINPAAVANAKYNAAMLVPGGSLEVRQVGTDSPGAFSIIADDERFDLILSNPPWEDGDVDKPADHAYYDPGFALMDTLLDGLPEHLTANGRCLLAYGHVPAIKRLESEAVRRGYEYKRLDDRDLSALPRDFLPGMLVEIRVPLSETKSD
jgi:methylase of polypeptide subunit release factors